ncbi:MAG TPA: hypothetical protein VGW36_07440 [Pyrinomonadaceae bacterium]|nr:hypothetical protein [Pyrinomonadaceae bacterium]
MTKLAKLRLILIVNVLGLAFISACSRDSQDQTTAVTPVSPPPNQVLQVVPRPEKILQLMKQRGEQDEAQPELKIISPANNSVIKGDVVPVRLALSGDLRGYQPHKDPATEAGNHIHVILDNEPYEAYYELGQPFELRNVAAGKHTLRVFPSRPLHESYKNAGAFQMVTFTVEGGGDTSKVTSTTDGQRMANNNSGQAAREGKDVAASKAGAVDLAKPLLTYSRPKGEYKGTDADSIMIDFWLSNAKLKGDGGEYRVRYIIDDDEARFIDTWQPIWLSGWTAGPHSVRIELLGQDGYPVENGGYNTTTREITVVK